MAKIGRLIVVIVVSTAFLLSALGLPVAASGSQDSGQNNPGGYVKYTLILANNTLVNGNFVNTDYAANPGPECIAYNPSNGYIYVANSYSDTVSVIDSATNKVIAKIPVGSLSVPIGVAYNPSNGYIYVTDWGSNTVSVIDSATNKVIAKIPVGYGPRGVAYDPSNGYIYVANSDSGTVSIISTGVSTNSSSISSVTAPATSTTSTSTEPTPSAVPAWAVAAIVAVAVLVVALLMIKRRRPQL